MVELHLAQRQVLLISGKAASAFLNSKIYIFGGEGFVTSGTLGFLADMWNFDPLTAMWLYLGGSQALNDVGVYGASNSYSIGFKPGGRYGAGMSQNKAGNELIIYGGYGKSFATTAGFLGDIWYFRLSDNSWAYIAGHTTVNQFGTFSTPQQPGTRDDMVFAGSLGREMCFIFGGNGYNNAGTGFLNDLWSFNQTSGLFASLARGNYSEANVVGTYGTKGSAAPRNCPGSRSGTASYFDNTSNRMILYGGYGYVSVGNYLNDVWSFDVSSGNWAWISGSNEPNQLALADRVGSRNGHGISAFSPTSFYVFGGQGYSSSTIGYLNDLWLHTAPDNWILVGGSLNLDVRGDYFDESATRRPSTSSSATLTNTVMKIAPRIAAAAPRVSSLSPEIIGVIVAVTLLLFGFLAIVITCVRYRRSKQLSAEKPFTYSETTTKVITSDGTTIAPTSLGLSLPGHLVVDEMDFRCGELLASGGGGDVFYGDAIGFALIERCRSLVVKRLKNTNDWSLRLFEQEISVMYLLAKSQFVAKFVGFMLQPPVLLMKMYPDGSLLSFVTKDAIGRKWKLRFSLDITHGLMDIHSAQIAHCDIKPENVLIDRDSQGKPFCVITDFGIAQILSEKLVVVKYSQSVSIRGLSIHYAAPEVFFRFRNKLEFSGPMIFKAGDVFALAMSFYFVLCQKESWKN